MKMRHRLSLGFAIVLGVIAATGVGCGAAAPASAPAASAAPASAPAASASSAAAWGDPTVVKVATEPTKGSYLTDGAGRALYTYDQDSTMSACYADCARTWPPVIAPPATPISGPGVTKPIRSSERSDSTFQLAYGGAWLYYYAGDLAPGDVKGDGQGGVWHLAKP